MGKVRRGSRLLIAKRHSGREPAGYERLSAYHPGRNACARLGRARRADRQRRRLRRPPGVRRRADRPIPRRARLPSRHDRTAQMGRSHRRIPHGCTAPLRRHHQRQPRQHAQQADCAEEGALRRSILAGRSHQHAPQSREHRLRQSLPAGLLGCADRSRWHRGIPSTHRSLRLLERFDSPERSPRLQSRHADLRHGRAPGLGARRSAGRRRIAGRRAQHSRNSSRPAKRRMGDDRAQPFHPRRKARVPAELRGDQNQQGDASAK